MSVEKIASIVGCAENGTKFSHVITQSSGCTNIKSIFKFIDGEIISNLYIIEGEEILLFTEVLMDSEKEERAARKQKAQTMEIIFRNCFKKCEEHDNT